MNEKTLIGFVTYSGKDYILDEFLSKSVFGQVDDCGRVFDCFCVDTTLDGLDYSKKLESYGLDVKHLDWNPKELNVSQMLAHARELLRRKCLDGGYDYLMMLDSDIILRGRNWVKDLISYGKDMVGYPYNIFSFRGRNSVPCVLKSGRIFINIPPKERFKRGLDLFTWAELGELANTAKLCRVYATGLGCCLISRRVLENVPFRTHPKIVLGEDIWFWSEADEKGFESWVVLNRRPLHKHVGVWPNFGVRQNMLMDVVFDQVDKSTFKGYIVFSPLKQEEVNNG